MGLRKKSRDGAASADLATAETKVKARKNKARSTHAVLPQRQPIPPPPQPSARAQHLRPSTPAMTRSRSKTPSGTTNRPTPKRVPDSAEIIWSNPFNRQPWASPDLDRLLCSMDAQGYDYGQIIRKVKAQFPQLKHVPITSDMAHTRLAILDYRLDIDYFKLGLKKAKKASRESKAEPNWLRQRRNKERNKGKARATRGGGESSHHTLEKMKNSGSASGLNQKEGASGARPPSAQQGHEFAESSASAMSAREADKGEHEEHGSRESQSTEKTGSKHGRLIHERETEGDIVPPMVNNISKTNGTKGCGLEHGKMIHHDRNQSNVSSTFTGTTAVLPPSADDTLQAPEGSVYTRPGTPATSEASTTKARLPVLPSLPINPTPELPPMESEGQPSRAARLGRAIHSSPGQSHVVPVARGKVYVGSGIKQEDALTGSGDMPSASKSSWFNTSHCWTDEPSSPELRWKRTLNPSSNASKENEAIKMPGSYPSLENGEPGPSTIMPKPLSIKRAATTAILTKDANRERIIIEEPTPARPTHDTVATQKTYSSKAWVLEGIEMSIVKQRGYRTSMTF